MTRKPVKRSLLVKAEHRHNPPICSLSLVGGLPCLDFINTVDYRGDSAQRVDYLYQYGDLLAFSLRVGILKASEEHFLLSIAAKRPEEARLSLESARAFRENLAFVLTLVVASSSGHETWKDNAEAVNALKKLDEARRLAVASEHASLKDGQLRFHADRVAEGLDLPWLELVRNSLYLIESGQLARVKICGAVDCGWFFLDGSKNGKRRWCSMRSCGNREKARRFQTKKGNTH